MTNVNDIFKTVTDAINNNEKLIIVSSKNNKSTIQLFAEQLIQRNIGLIILDETPNDDIFFIKGDAVNQLVNHIVTQRNNG